jgi:transcriptional regulator with XRE-family HTH domain
MHLRIVSQWFFTLGSRPAGACILTDVMLRFGERLKVVRQKAGISQEKLAELACLHRTYVSSVERGQRNISLLNIEKLAEALDVELRDLMPERQRKSS